MQEPRTKAEWKEAADMANVALLIDSARQYGLITGGPAVDVRRCEEILEKAKRRGITPTAIEDLDLQQALYGG